MEHYINYQIVILMIYVIIGGAMITQIKNINKFYKLSIFIILLNLILTIFTPNMSLLNLLAYDDIKFNIADKDYWSIRGQIGDLLAGHFAALAFIGLMITITQMKEALKKQDEAISTQKQGMDIQIKHLNDSRKIDTMFNEANNISNLILKMALEIKPIPYENIKLLKKNITACSGYEVDFSNKVVEFKTKTGSEYVPWDNVMVYLNEIVKNNSKEDIDTMIQKNQITYITDYRTIASQLRNLIIIYKELSSLDGNSHNLISRQLSNFYEVIHVLDKLGLVEDVILELFYLLHSLGKVTSTIDVNLKDKFLNEIKEERLFEEDLIDRKDINDIKLEKNTKSGLPFVEYKIRYKNKILVRSQGEWSIEKDNER